MFNLIAISVDVLLLTICLAMNIYDKLKIKKEKHHIPYFSFQTRTDELYELPQATYPGEMYQPQEENSIPLYDSSVLSLSGYQGSIVHANDIQEHPYFVVSNIEVRFQSINKESV